MRHTFSYKNELIYTVNHFGINPETRELYLCGFDDEEEIGVDYRMAYRFIQNIRILETLDNSKSILIHQSTCGGEWNYGMAIYDAIKSCQCHVTILIHASGRSMSSIIPQAADTRIIMPNADFMIHYGTLSLDTNSVSAKSEVDWNEMSNKIMLDIYTNSCKSGQFFKDKAWTEEKIRKFLDEKMLHKQEWYLLARDAVNYGFVDAVLGDKGYETIEKLRGI